jgi:DNA polymerase elongation subunit (family B)
VQYGSGKVDVRATDENLLYGMHLRYDELRAAPVHRYDAEQRSTVLGLEPRHGINVRSRESESGELKVRGIAVRRKDTPTLVEDLQRDMLGHLAAASDAVSFLERVPSSLEVLDRYVEEVRSGSVSRDRLVMRRSVSRRLEEYVQFNDSVAALRQLHDRGFELQPGQSVEYLITDSKSGSSWQRVRAAPFLDGDERYDAERYVDFTLRGAAELLSPFGWGFKELRDRDDRGRSRHRQERCV